MELCVAMKYCITRYSLNETGVLKKFALWLFHAKNITSLGIKPRAPMAHWAPGCIGCSLVPSGVFLLPPWDVNLCHMAGLEHSPARGMCSPCCSGKRKPSEGVPGLGQVHSLLTVAADYVGGGIAAVTAAMSCAQSSESASREEVCSGWCCEWGM